MKNHKKPNLGLWLIYRILLTQGYSEIEIAEILKPVKQHEEKNQN